MGCRERGMALVSVVILLTVLLSLAHILFDKVMQSTRQRARSASREKVYWAAYGGIEFARDKLAANYASSGGWLNYLQEASDSRYPASPIWSEITSGINVDIYLRDNLDGDQEVHRDNDLKIYVLAHARGDHGTEAVIEGLCGFETTTGSSGMGSGAGTRQTDLSLTEHPVSTYQSLE